jgi:trimethylamine:corrinoid methyltransferase-like protein
MDSKTGGYVNASLEDAQHTAIVTALGRYYHIPCRSQGALTESFSLDYQAGMESSMMLTTAALSGGHVSLHAKWLEMEPGPMDQRASKLLETRLLAYEKPDIDPVIEKDLI